MRLVVGVPRYICTLYDRRVTVHTCNMSIIHLLYSTLPRDTTLSSLSKQAHLGTTAYTANVLPTLKVTLNSSLMYI